MSRTLILVALILSVAALWGVIAIFKTAPPAELSIIESGSILEATQEEKTHSPTVLAEGLLIPWGIAFLPDGGMLVTERVGRVIHIQSGEIYEVPGVAHVGEGGLLGIALHPRFGSDDSEETRFVYLYHTTESSGGLINRVDRYTFIDGALSYERTILDNLPGARYHDGGRIAFGPDKMLYVTVGDAGSAALAQDTESYAGKILRITPEGGITEGNPFDNAVYSYGHRNPQGLTWDEEDTLWSTEHGRSVPLSGFDELNRIEPGVNYGWPESQGDTARPGTVAPTLHSTASVTWAPASAAYHNESIFFGGLRSETLYEAVLEEGEVIELKEHFREEYGRIRTVTLGPDGFLYFTTSNRDGRGSAEEEDDRLIRVHPDFLQVE